jgi:hypothetical protein
MQVRLVRVADSRDSQKRRVHVSNLTISNEKRVSPSHHSLNREIVQRVFILYFFSFFTGGGFNRRLRIRCRRHVRIDHQTISAARFAAAATLL